MPPDFARADGAGPVSHWPRPRATVLRALLLGVVALAPSVGDAAQAGAAPNVMPPVVATEVPASLGGAVGPRLLRVGPHRAIMTIAEAARDARDGDTVEIDAGVYVQDVATWPQSNLTIRAGNGMAYLVAGGKSAGDKAIWVIKGTNVLVENISFAGTRVPGRNGAGIRHEGGKLTVRGCVFERNEIGLLTSNSPAAELEVESSVFRDNVVLTEPVDIDPGHQLYVGSIARFSLRESYVSHGANGHLVKSRARENRILYNRITDEARGYASYELEFPNGGIAYVVGNIVEQSARSRNEVMISFGAEGYRWPRNELYLAHNTLVDRYPMGGRFLRVWPGADRVLAVNNLLVGLDRLDHEGAGNVYATAAVFGGPADYDFRLRAGTAPVGRAIDPGTASGIALRPDREYVHPLRSRPVSPRPYSPGAQQSVDRLSNRASTPVPR